MGVNTATELNYVQELLQKNSRYNIVISTYELHDCTIARQPADNPQSIQETSLWNVTPEKKC